MRSHQAIDSRTPATVYFQKGATSSGTNLTFHTFTTALNFAEILECRGYHPYDFIH